MKYVIATFIFSLALVPTLVLNAQAVGKTNLFSIGEIVIDRVEEDQDTARFLVNLNENDSKDVISYWKVRMYCEEGVTLNISITDENECGKAVTITEQYMSSFLLFFKTNTGKVSDFSFAVKAYDSNGDWLQTERRNFSWK